MEKKLQHSTSIDAIRNNQGNQLNAKPELSGSQSNSNENYPSSKAVVVHAGQSPQHPDDAKIFIKKITHEKKERERLRFEK